MFNVGDRVRLKILPEREMEVVAVGPGDWRRAKWTDETGERVDDFLTDFIELVPANRPKAKGSK